MQWSISFGLLMLRFLLEKTNTFYVENPPMDICFLIYFS